MNIKEKTVGIAFCLAMALVAVVVLVGGGTAAPANAQVSSQYCATQDAVWHAGYWQAQHDYHSASQYDARSHAQVPTDDYEAGYSQGWADATAGLMESCYNR